MPVHALSAAARSRTTEPYLALGAAVVIVGAIAWLVAGDGVAPSGAAEEVVPVVAWEQDGFRYEYHVLTARECLYRLGGPGVPVVNVLPRHPDVAAVHRRALERKLGVESLDELRAPYAEEIRALERLGYL